MLGIQNLIFTVIIEPIESPKSSLLMALLGEMTLMKGIANVQGSKSFAAQKPWIFAGSVKENVVFYRKFEKDIEILLQGDEAIIGERGVNLSGGQKARVALARNLLCSQRFLFI
jgi:ATP-binding cassette subfamily C (CFTR/MRP) protein 4